jgi:hypothetical protein
MCLFHDEDHVGPVDQLGGQRMVGVATDARRGSFQIVTLREDLLSRRATQTAAAAEE